MQASQHHRHLSKLPLFRRPAAVTGAAHSSGTAEQACRKAAQGTYGSRAIKLSSPELAETYRADKYGYVIAQDVPEHSDYAFKLEHSFPDSR